MSADSRQVMSEALGFEPIFIEVGAVTRCRRPMYFWCQPEHFAPWQGECRSGEVLEVIPGGGPGRVDRWLGPGCAWDGCQGEDGSSSCGSGRRLPTLVRSIPRSRPPQDPAGISECDSEKNLQRQELREKSGIVIVIPGD